MKTNLIIILFFLALPLAAQPDPPAPLNGFTVKWQRDLLITWSDGYKTYMNLTWPDFKNPPTNGWPGVALMHGKGGSRKSSSISSKQQALAQAGYVTFAYDTRGDGDTIKLNPNMTLGSPARRLLDVAEGYHLASQQLKSLLDLKRLGITGKSMGGGFTLKATSYSGQQLPLTGYVKTMPTIGAAIPDIQSLDHVEDYFPGGVLAQTKMALRSYASGGASSPMVKGLMAGNYAALRLAMEKDQVSNFTPRLKLSTVPLMVMFSWNDHYHNSNVNTDTFAMLKKGVPRRYFVTTGGHGTPGNTIESAMRSDYIRRWFDRFLKGIKNGVDQEPFADLATVPASGIAYLNPASSWAHRLASQWPPTFTKTRRYLRKGSKLDKNQPVAHEVAHVVQQRRSANYSLLNFLADGATPAKVNLGLPYVAGKFDDQPLPQAGELLGRPVVEVVAECNQSTFQVCASIWDVAPGGKAQWLTMGATALRNAKPGSHRLRIELGEISYVVPAGNHLRLTIHNVALRQPTGSMHYLWLPEFADYDIKISTQPTALTWVDLPLRPLATATLAPRIASAQTSTGFKQVINITGEDFRAKSPYILLIGSSGISPTIHFPAPLHLKPDLWTDIGLFAVNSSYFANFLGTLDAQGQSQATFNLPQGYPELAGTRFTFSLVGIYGGKDTFTAGPIVLKANL